jgi:hypothetical protein
MLDLTDLQRRYETWTTAELIDLLAAPDQYRADAVRIARAVLSNRRVHIDEAELLWRRDLWQASQSRQMDIDDCERVADLVALIRSSFSALTAIMDDPLTLEFPMQPGLAFPLRLYSPYSDEFQLMAGAFQKTWWLPGTPDLREECLDLMTGLIAGSYRLIEEYALGRLVRVQLERQTANDWETCATRVSLLGLLFRHRERRVLHNSPHGAGAV